MKKITRKYLDKKIGEYATTKKVLDIGCGGQPYASFFPNRITVDIAKHRNPDILADAQSLPLKEASYEFVLCTEMLEHVEDPQKVINEIYRVLKEGGVCILTTRFVYPLHDIPHDYHRFTKYTLQKMFQTFAYYEVEAETESFSAIAALLQRLVFQSKLRLNKPVKLLLLTFAWILDHLNWIIIEEYGDIEKRKKDTHIFTTGYIVHAIK